MVFSIFPSSLWCYNSLCQSLMNMYTYFISFLDFLLSTYLDIIILYSPLKLLASIVLAFYIYILFTYSRTLKYLLFYYFIILLFTYHRYLISSLCSLIFSYFIYCRNSFNFSFIYSSSTFYLFFIVIFYLIDI